jgi:transposase
MAKPMQLRPLTRREQRLLRSKLRDLSLSARVHQRYRLIDWVRRGVGPQETASRVGCHFTVVYDWMRRFNVSGFTTFEQVPNPKGRPPILQAGQLRELVDVALSSPTERGLPFSTWSVPKLAEYCRQAGLLPPVTDEWVRRLLRREGLSAQRIRTWKTSHDPAFDRKKNGFGRSTGAARRGPRWSASTSGGRWR